MIDLWAKQSRKTTINSKSVNNEMKILAVLTFLNYILIKENEQLLQ